MSLITITDAQRYEIGYRACIAGNLTQRFINDSRVITEAQATAINDALTSLITALAAAGYSTVPAGSAIVANNDTVSVRNSAGADAHTGTAVVDSGALTGVNLAATVAMVDNSDTVSVQNSAGANGIDSTAVVASGTITAVRLPATAAALQNGHTVQVRRSDGTTVIGSATLSVSSGVVDHGVLPATVTGFASGFALTGVTPTGTYTNTVTFTVAGGVITAIHLS